MNIYESAENYLETILILQEQNKTVRSIDIANHLNFSKPSVSIAMKNLRQNGYIEINSEGYISLTEKGKAIADATFDKHQTIAQLLITLGVNSEQAYEDACKIEHYISNESFTALKNHLKQISK